MCSERRSFVASKSCIVNEFAGVSRTHSATYAGDGESSKFAEFSNPHGIWLTTDNKDLLIADSTNGRVRKVSLADGVVHLVAGGGKMVGNAGDGGSAKSPAVSMKPWYMCGDKTGIVYVVDTNNGVVRKIDDKQIISTFVGIVSTNSEVVQAARGVNGPATSASFNFLSHCAVDANNDVYLTATNNHMVFKVTKSNGIVRSFAGNGGSANTVHSGVLTSSSLVGPSDVFIDTAGRMFISESATGRVYRIDSGTNTMTLFSGFIGAGSNLFSGDGGAATSAGFAGQWKSISLDNYGNMFVSATNTFHVRYVQASTGIVTTIAGSQTHGFEGNGGPATSALFRHLSDVVVSGETVYVCDKTNNVVRALTCTSSPADTHHQHATVSQAKPATVKSAPEPPKVASAVPAKPAPAKPAPVAHDKPAVASEPAKAAPAAQAKSAAHTTTTAANAKPVPVKPHPLAQPDPAEAAPLNLTKPIGRIAAKHRVEAAPADVPEIEALVAEDNQLTLGSLAYLHLESLPQHVTVTIGVVVAVLVIVLFYFMCKPVDQSIPMYTKSPPPASWR